MKRSKILYGLYLSQLAFLASLPDGINTEWKQRHIPTAAVNLSIYKKKDIKVMKKVLKKHPELEEHLVLNKKRLYALIGFFEVYAAVFEKVIGKEWE